MFSHTIIYPRAVVIILSDTCVTNITVVGSEGFTLDAAETYRLQVNGGGVRFCGRGVYEGVL